MLTKTQCEFPTSVWGNIVDKGWCWSWVPGTHITDANWQRLYVSINIAKASKWLSDKVNGNIFNGITITEKILKKTNLPWTQK